MTKFDKIWKWLFTPYETIKVKRTKKLLNDLSYVNMLLSKF
jgi:hypothetical protein